MKGKTQPIEIFSPSVRNAMSFTKSLERPKITTHLIGREEETKRLNKLLNLTRGMELKLSLSL